MIFGKQYELADDEMKNFSERNYKGIAKTIVNMPKDSFLEAPVGSVKDVQDIVVNLNEMGIYIERDTSRFTMMLRGGPELKLLIGNSK